MTTGTTGVLAAALLLPVILSGCSNGDAPPPAGWRVLPAADSPIPGPRAVEASGSTAFVLDGAGWYWRLSADGEVENRTQLVKTRRGFPVGVTMEPGGELLLADTHEARVLRLTTDGEKRESFGSYGCEPGQFVYPQRIALVGDEVFVTEYGFRVNCRVQVFHRDGTFRRIFGQYGVEGAAFARPAGIHAAPDGNLYIADASHRILVWTPAGEFVRDFGEQGKEPGRLLYPTGLTGDDRYLYFTEHGNSRLSRYTYEGDFAGCFGGPGSGEGQFANPRDLALAPPYLYVADTGNDRIVRLTLSDIQWRMGS